MRVNVRAVPGGGVRVFQPRENDRVTVAERDGAFLFTHTMSIFNVWKHWTCCAGRMTSHWSYRWTLPARYASKHATPVSRSRAFSRREGPVW